MTRRRSMAALLAALALGLLGPGLPSTSTGRQRHEATGNRISSSSLQWKLGETWRVTYSMYIPGSLMATTSFTHLIQTKQPGTGSSPITVTSLRRVDGVQTIEHKVIAGDVLVGRTNLEPRSA